MHVRSWLLSLEVNRRDKVRGVRFKAGHHTGTIELAQTEPTFLSSLVLVLVQHSDGVKSLSSMLKI